MTPGNDLIYLILLNLASLVFGVLMIFCTVITVSSLFLGKKASISLSENNTASSLFLVSVIISTAMLSTSTFVVLQQNLHLVNQMPEHTRIPYILNTMLLALLQIIFTFVLSLLIAFVSTKMYDMMTWHIKEYEEIRKGNVSVGLLLGGIVIGLTIFIQYQFAALVAALIPMPNYIIPQ